MFLIYCILSFFSISFSTEPQPLFIFLQSEAGSNNKRDKTKSCKYQSHEGKFVSEIDKYIVSFLFDYKGLNLVYQTNIYLFFFSFLKLKISMKFEKIRIFILQFDSENSRPNQKLFFQDANFLPAALIIKDQQ